MRLHFFVAGGRGALPTYPSPAGFSEGQSIADRKSKARHGHRGRKSFRASAYKRPYFGESCLRRTSGGSARPPDPDHPFPGRKHPYSATKIRRRHSHIRYEFILGGWPGTSGTNPYSTASHRPGRGRGPYEVGRPPGAFAPRRARRTPVGFPRASNSQASIKSPPRATSRKVFPGVGLLPLFGRSGPSAGRPGPYTQKRG
jgi:hypothetical protein